METVALPWFCPRPRRHRSPASVRRIAPDLPHPRKPPSLTLTTPARAESSRSGLALCNRRRKIPPLAPPSASSSSVSDHCHYLPPLPPWFRRLCGLGDLAGFCPPSGPTLDAARWRGRLIPCGSVALGGKGAPIVVLGVGIGVYVGSEAGTGGGAGQETRRR
jgi:hypothetical protein